MKKAAMYLLLVGILAALATPATAETRTISWDPVTTYTDGTPIEAGKTLTYSAYWTTDSGLGSLHTIGTSLAATSTTFDPDVQGMAGGGTVYFTAKAVADSGEASALSPAYAWVVPLATAPAVLSGVTVSGPSSMNEGGTGAYTATGTWDNGATASVIPTWSVSSTNATIGTGGLLTAATVTSTQTVTVTGTYGGKTGTMGVTIVDVPGSTPAVPMNTGISGPITSGAKEAWRLAWDPVTTYADAAPLEPGRTVSYMAYWTDDPTLSSASLRPLASPVSATTVDFIPGDLQMRANKHVYLTVQSVLDDGVASSFAASLKWVVANAGPVPPGKGRIIKK